jgi:hypothetical protein
MQDVGTTYATLFKTVAATGFVKTARMSALRKALLLGGGGVGLAGLGGGAGYALGNSGADEEAELARQLGFESGIGTAEGAYEDALAQLAAETPYEGLY